MNAFCRFNSGKPVATNSSGTVALSSAQYKRLVLQQLQELWGGRYGDLFELWFVRLNSVLDSCARAANLKRVAMSQDGGTEVPGLGPEITALLRKLQPLVSCHDIAGIWTAFFSRR